MRAGVCLSAFAAAKPPNPPPTITICGAFSLIAAFVLLPRLIGPGRRLVLRSEFEKPHQHLVFLLRELIYRAAACFPQHSVDNGLLKFGSDVGIPDAFHQARQR